MQFRIWPLPMIISIFFLLGCAAGKVELQSENKNLIHHVLCGNVGPRDATLVVQTTEPANLSLKVFEKLKNKKIIDQKFRTSNNLDHIKKIQIKDLSPGNEYVYLVSQNNKAWNIQGQFKTFPKNGETYKFVFGSCQETGTESEIFTKIINEAPLFYLQIGDLHYENIGEECQRKFDSTYQVVFSSKAQAALYRNCPFAYMWDDHDYGPNNSDASNPCRTIAIQQYKKHFPHYPLAFETATGPISQSFDVGRVTYLLTDLRSQKTPPIYEDCLRKVKGSNFGSTAHLDWFLNSMLEAKRKGHVVAWISSYPWINAAGGPNYKCNEKDNWGGYPEERTQIADFIKKHQIPIFILSGDAHMVAMDDGRNSDYATGGGAPIRVFQAGAIDRPGSYKGGPYSHGYSKEPAQYGVIEVSDKGATEICFKWYAKNLLGQSVVDLQGNEIRMDFCFQLPK